MLDMSDAFADIGTPVRMQVVSKSIQDFEVKEQKQEPVTFLGVLQPTQPTKLRARGEGQRSFQRWYLWTTKALQLDSIIVDHLNVQFRVAERLDWRAGGYNKYGLIENVTPL